MKDSLGFSEKVGFEKKEDRRGKGVWLALMY